MIYRLTHLKRTSPKLRTELISGIEARINKLNQRDAEFQVRTGFVKFGPAVFGIKSSSCMAELFVQQFEKMVVQPRLFREFCNAANASGYRSRVRGKLFHLFVRNFSPLHQDFYQHAIRQVAELNNPEVGASFEPGTLPPHMFTAKGEEFERRVPFGPPLKAWDICIIKRNGKRVEFVDDMYVSHADDNGQTLWSFLCEIEVKTAGAAGGFGKQIGFSQTRIGHEDVACIELKVEGHDEAVRVMPVHILLSQRTIDRNAISFLGKNSWARLGDDIRSRLASSLGDGNLEEIYANSDFRFQATKRGNGEVFRRITLAVNAEFFDGYVNAIWPIAK